MRLHPSMGEQAPDRFAVDGDHFALESVRERADPFNGYSFEGVQVDQHEHAPKRVMQGNAVCKFQ